MKGGEILKKPRLEKAKNDVDIIRKEAKIFVEINKDGDIEQVRRNYQGKINTMAIIGPIGVIDNEIKKERLERISDQKTFLLLEIGLFRGKPYRAGRDAERKNGSFYVPPRHKWFFLSDSQYCRVAPFLFKWLQEESLSRINNWKREPFLRRKKGFQKQARREGELLCARAGICFSVSLRDTYIASDVLWASANNEVRKRFLRWLCELSVKKLCYRKRKKKNREDLWRIISWRPKYVIEDMLEFLPKEKMFFFNEIADLSRWNQEETEERRLRNLVLPNPQKRVGEIEMRIKRIDKKKEIVIFEVFPK